MKFATCFAGLAAIGMITFVGLSVGHSLHRHSSLLDSNNVNLARQDGQVRNETVDQSSIRNDSSIDDPSDLSVEDRLLTIASNYREWGPGRRNGSLGALFMSVPSPVGYSLGGSPTKRKWRC